MKEKSIAIILTIILVIAGIIAGLLAFGIYTKLLSGESISNYNEFNFYKSNIQINETHIKETLTFHTNKEYHTLFRTFDSSISTKERVTKNSISITSVECNSGTPYFRVSGVCYLKPDFTKSADCPEYTENNEYGCTFGNTYGFNDNSDYEISSEYELNPENIFKINGNYYIKFIAYGRNSHNSLSINRNLFIMGESVYREEYLSDEYVIIYIPYTGKIDSINVIEKSDFEYDKKTTKKLSEFTIILLFLGLLFLHLLPALIFLLSWNFFGKELREEDIPSQLSDYPNKRKPWEVAAFFNPPFGTVDANMFSTMLLDFYRRKIIDLKLKDGFFKKEMMIKINNKTEDLDNVEKEFLGLLGELESLCPKKHIENGYFNLNKAGSSFIGGFSLKTKQLEFKKSVEKESKKYLEKKGVVIFILSIIILMIISFALTLFSLGGVSIFSLVIVGIVATTTSILIRYKENFYSEYQKWQAFKNWLKNSSSMRKTGTKGVVFWEEYLVYATALGVSKQVLKELKEEGIINDKTYAFYSGFYVSSTSFTSSSSGGGFGGAGAGGVGGGGGGGR